MKVKDLLHRIDNVNTTPIIVDNFRTNTVHTAFLQNISEGFIQ